MIDYVIFDLRDKPITSRHVIMLSTSHGSKDGLGPHVNYGNYTEILID